MTNLRPHEVENTFLVIIASSQLLVVPEVEKIKHGYQDTKYKSTSLKVEVTTGHSFVCLVYGSSLDMSISSSELSGLELLENESNKN